MSNGNLEVKLEGRYGNQLFMYFNARIFSEKNKLNLTTNPPDGALDIINNKTFGTTPKGLKNIIIHDNCYNSKDNCYNYQGNGNYLFQGYFQKEEIIHENLNLVKSWINYNIDKKNYAVIHIRLSDFYNPDRSLIISQNYYIDSIKKYCKNYKDIIIVHESLNYVWEYMYINNLKEKIKNLDKNIIYKNNSIKDDYKCIINSNLIITSNSTFCFWPMILSNADKIVSFPYFGYNIEKKWSVCKWPGEHSVFQYKNNNYILNNIYDDNIIKYFENMKYYESFIIYYINLDKDKNRDLFIKNELKEKNLLSERIPAVIGSKLEKFDYDNIMCDNIKFTHGQLGCYMSHINCYEKFLKTDFDYLIILEDDIKLKDNFNEKLSDLLLFLEKNNNIDFIYLSRSQTVVLKNSFTPKKDKINNDFIFSPDVCGYGFHSYVLTKKGCDKFLKILKESEKNLFKKNKAIPIDCMDRWLTLGNRINIKLNVYALREEITKTRGLNSNTSI